MTDRLDAVAETIQALVERFESHGGNPSDYSKKLIRACFTYGAELLRQLEAMDESFTMNEAAIVMDNLGAEYFERQKKTWETFTKIKDLTTEIRTVENVDEKTPRFVRAGRMRLAGRNNQEISIELGYETQEELVDDLRRYLEEDVR